MNLPEVCGKHGRSTGDEKGSSELQKQ